LIDTSDLEPDRHTIFIESQDANGNFGVPTAIFLAVLDFPEDGEVIDGTNKKDTLVGTKASEVIYGRGGNDRIAGGLGDDLLFGNGGADV
jgi:Ca2+-binding RTX toxin-like protein